MNVPVKNKPTLRVNDKYSHIVFSQTISLFINLDMVMFHVYIALKIKFFPFRLFSTENNREYIKKYIVDIQYLLYNFNLVNIFGRTRKNGS